MAIDYNYLRTLPQDEAIQYLQQNAPASINPSYTVTEPISEGGGSQGYWSSPEAGQLGRTEEGSFTAPLTTQFDPNYAGGVYGQYFGRYGTDGKLQGVDFKKGERHEGFLSENLDWIGPLMVAGAGAWGGGLFSGLGSSTVSPYSLAQPGTSVTLGNSTTTLGGGSIGGGALGSGLTPGVASTGIGGGALGTGISGNAASWLTDTPWLSDAAMADIVGSTTADVLTGSAPEQLTNALDIVPGGEPAVYGIEAQGALTPLQQLQNAYWSAGNALNVAMGSTPFANAVGSATGTAAGNALTSAATKAAPSLLSKALTAITGGGDSGGSGGGSSGLGGLGGLGGILGLALLMAQLRKDKDAAPAGQMAPIPRLRSRVEQKPFTLDAQGNKQAPLAYFGNPVNYASGGGIGGLAAGGETSRAIRGPGDGVSDSIPAKINGNEPAALADGEFVIDARTVAELGNGSTEAGTRKLEAMVNRVHEARAKARRGEDSNADRHMPV